jgi:hypothetical protein
MPPSPRRSFLSSTFAVALLFLLAAVGRRPEPVKVSDEPTQSGPPGETGTWAAHPLVHLLLFAVLVAANALVLFVFEADQQLAGIFIASSLGAVTIWSTWMLFIGGTPAPRGKGGLVVLLRLGVLALCGLLSAYYWLKLDAEARSDKASVGAFAVCTVFAVVLDAVQGRRNKRRSTVLGVAV